MGMPPYEAWTLNRTSIVGELAQRGEESLARHYADFYLAGWDGFRSGFQDESAARRALSAAFQLYAEGVSLL